MTAPSMESANAWARVMSEMQALKREVRELRAASGTLDSATIYKGGLTVKGGDGVRIRGEGVVDTFDETTGGRMLLGQGSLSIWDNFNENPDGFGRIYCDPGSGYNYFRFYPPHTAGDGRADSITIQGETPDEPGNMWAFTGGEYTVVAGGRAYMEAANWNVLTGGEFGLYDLPTTGSAANLTLGYVGDTWTVAMSTSSERYKTDIAPVQVDPAEVLELTGITWVHNDAMDHSPEGPIARNVGWHAEQIDSKPSLRQFVNYDEEGRPDSVEDSRMTVALLELCKAQQAQIDALSTRLDALE